MRRATWYAKYRLPDGRQVQKRIGPAWTQRGRPPAVYFTKRTAEDWLRGVLDEVRRGTLRRVRSVRMARDVAEMLARLGQRGHATSDDDLVFPGDAGGYRDASRLRRRYDRELKRAGLRPLRIHDLRHTFSTRIIAPPDIRRCRNGWASDVQTTMRRLHYAPRHDDAAVSAVFRVASSYRYSSPSTRKLLRPAALRPAGCAGVKSP